MRLAVLSLISNVAVYLVISINFISHKNKVESLGTSLLPNSDTDEVGL